MTVKKDVGDNSLAKLFAFVKDEISPQLSARLDAFAEAAPPPPKAKKQSTKKPKSPKKKKKYGNPYLSMWAKSKLHPKQSVWAIYAGMTTYVFTDEDEAKAKAKHLSRDLERKRYDNLFFDIRPGQRLIVQGMIHSKVKVTPTSVIIRLEKTDSVFYHRPRSYSADTLIQIMNKLSGKRGQHVGQALAHRDNLRYVLDCMDIVYTATDLIALGNIIKDVFNIDFNTDGYTTNLQANHRPVKSGLVREVIK